MPCSTWATFGAVSAIRRLTSSEPSGFVYMSLHGEPPGAVGDPAGVRLKQSSAMLEKPMSLPPIVRLTFVVSASSESNCGGFGPGDTPCEVVMWLVFAPLHVGSRNAAVPSRPAAKWA